MKYRVKFWDLRKPQYSVKTLDDFPNSYIKSIFLLFLIDYHLLNLINFTIS